MRFPFSESVGTFWGSLVADVLSETKLMLAPEALKKLLNVAKEHLERSTTPQCAWAFFKHAMLRYYNVPVSPKPLVFAYVGGEFPMELDTPEERCVIAVIYTAQHPDNWSVQIVRRQELDVSGLLTRYYCRFVTEGVEYKLRYGKRVAYLAEAEAFFELLKSLGFDPIKVRKDGEEVSV